MNKKIISILILAKISRLIIQIILKMRNFNSLFKNNNPIENTIKMKVKI